MPERPEQLHILVWHRAQRADIDGSQLHLHVHGLRQILQSAFNICLSLQSSSQLFTSNELSHTLLPQTGICSALKNIP